MLERAIREALAPEGFRVLAPDLNVPSFQKLDFKTMSRISFWEIKKHLPAVVVGSSLGAVVALDAARYGLACPLVLVAPALGFGPRWQEKLPPGDPIRVFHFGMEREVEIHRRFFEEMARVDVESEPPRVAVRVLFGTDDESVPVEQIRSVWGSWERSGRLPSGSRKIEIPGGDHGLLAHVGRIVEEILDAAGPVPSAVPRSGSAERRTE